MTTDYSLDRVKNWLITQYDRLLNQMVVTILDKKANLRDGHT